MMTSAVVETNKNTTQLNKRDEMKVQRRHWLTSSS